MTTTDESSDHFSTLDDVLAPQPWMQHRLVKTESEPAASRTYAASGGLNKDDELQHVQTHWTNNTPIPQLVYGMVGHGGHRVTLQAGSRGYIQEKHAYWSGVQTPMPLPLVEVSRFGTGVTVSAGGIVGAEVAFAQSEVRANSHTYPFMPHLLGWFLVLPGEKFNVRVETRFVTEFWETKAVADGEDGTGSSIVAGELSVSLYATPVLGSELGVGKAVPALVGSPTHKTSASNPVCVAKPNGVVQDDVLLALVANQFGLGSDIQPPDDTWHKLANVNGTLVGWEDVHFKVFMHVCNAGEPAEYCFTNGMFAEMTIHLLALRQASTALEDGWAVATHYSSPELEWQRHRHHYELAHVYTREHFAPSISRGGQALVCSSFFSHSLWQQDPIYGLGENVIFTATPDDTGTGHYRMGMIYEFEVPGRITELCFFRHVSSATLSRQIQLYRGTALVAVSEPTEEIAGRPGWVRANLTNPIEVKANEVFTVVFPEPGGSYWWNEGPPEVTNAHMTLRGSVASTGSTGSVYPTVEPVIATRFTDVVFEPRIFGTGLTQEHPAGMTELFDDNGNASSMSTAIEYGTPEDPLPNPTGDRMFVASDYPKHSGNSITVSVLVPGARIVTATS